MTCIVGLEMDGKAYIGGDSAGVGGLDITSRADEKVFKVGSMIFGFTSSFRMGQILRYKLTLPDKKVGQDDYNYLCTQFIDAVILALESNGYGRVKENSKEGGTFIIGYNGKIYVIFSDYQVGRSLLGYDAVGCGAEYAKGAMAVLLTSSYRKDKTPLGLIELALQAAEVHSAGVIAPFHLLSEAEPA